MGGGTTDTSTNNEPWGPQADALRRIFGLSEDIYDQGPLDYFSRSTVGGRSAATLESEAGALDRVRNDRTAPVGAYLDDVISGRYLDIDSNPNLRAVGDAAAQDITRHYQTAIAPNLSLAGHGRAGSSAEATYRHESQRDLGDSLSQMYSGLYGGQYEAERGRQQGASALMPQIQGSRRADLAFGHSMGESADAYDQRLLNDLIARFEFDRDEPSLRLSRHRSNIVDGLSTVPGAGGSSTSSSGGGAQTAGAVIGGVGALASLIGSISAASACSRKFKIEHDEDVDGEEVLKQLLRLPIAIWEYKPEVQDQTKLVGHHVGPYAEDFERLFGIGDGEQIFLMDGIGIALAAIKHLAGRVQDLEKQVGGESIPVLEELTH